MARERLLRLKEVESLTALRKSSLYALIRAGKFPKGVQLTARTTAWPETKVLAWVQERIAAAEATK